VIIENNNNFVETLFVYTHFLHYQACILKKRKVGFHIMNFGLSMTFIPILFFRLAQLWGEIHTNSFLSFSFIFMRSGIPACLFFFFFQYFVSDMTVLAFSVGLNTLRG